MKKTARAATTINPAAVHNLRQHYLFAALDDHQWARLQPRAHARALTCGERLFSQGEPATAFFVVCSGSVKLFRDSAQGLEKIMRLVRSGQSFAESVLFSDPPYYPVHAQAITASRLVAVDRDTYLALLRESFDSCLAVMAQMVNRIHAHWDEIETLSLHGSQAQVARYLLGLYASRGKISAASVQLPTRKVLVAAQLGLAPETLSRALHSLSESGLITVKGACVDIRDLEALRRRAQI